MASELAQAYVQIIPSAKGMQGRITEALGGEAHTAGKSAGHAIAGSIKNILVTAGIGAALGKALTEGANLEQNIGGIETLFKESADIIKQRADKAYRTAGMSANEYMELTTSFSASLLQSLEGDTRKAADISDMAMTDMSDNANKMGTDMQRISDAYQGFAKQNYTMLDNLKLGYGGTKGEMERLLKDAQKISGVEYNIDNLSDVYQAIHVIQGELDITGTTAKEAASTLSGSAKAMQSAFKNVLGNLTLGEDIGPALNALAETTTTFLIGNLLPAVWNILQALPGALVSFISTAAPQIANGLMSFVPSLQTAVEAASPALLESAWGIVHWLVNGIETNYPKMIQAGGAVLSKLVDGIVNVLPQLAQMGFILVGNLVGTLVQNLPQIIETGGTLLRKMIDGIQAKIPDLMVTAGRVVLNLVEGLVRNFPSILKSGFDMIVKIIQGIGNALPHMVSAASEIVSMIWDTITQTDWLQLGKDIIMGLINGIGAMGGALWDAAKNVAHSVLDSIKGALDIHSPSRVMRDQVGKWIPAGIAEGINGNAAPVRRAMKDIASMTTGRLSGNLAMSLRPAYAMPMPAGGYGHQTILNQTIYTHDSLSESELTREAEDMLARQKWDLP